MGLNEVQLFMFSLHRSLPVVGSCLYFFALFSFSRHYKEEEIYGAFNECP